MTIATRSFSLTVSAPAGLPTWAQAISVGSWGTASGNLLSSLMGAAVPARSAAGLFAYSGGAFAAGFSQHGALLVTGGGHNDYYGNEVGAWNATTGLWSILGSYPTDGGGGTTNYVDAEQNPAGSGSRPATCHTYNCLQYIPGPVAGNTKGLLVRPHASALADLNGNFHSGRSHAFNLDTAAWARFAAGLAPVAAAEYAGATAYDSASNAIWWMPKGTYAPRKLTAAGAWSTSSVASIPLSYTSVAVYVPTVQKVFVFDPNLAPWTVNVITTANNALQTVTPASGPVAQGADIAGAGAAWCGDLGKILVYPYFASAGVQNRGTIYTFDPVTMTWGTLVNSTTAVTAPYGGVWGRFQYVPAAKCAVIAPTVSSNVMAYRVA